MFRDVAIVGAVAALAACGGPTTNDAGDAGDVVRQDVVQQDVVQQDVVQQDIVQQDVVQTDATEGGGPDVVMTDGGDAAASCSTTDAGAAFNPQHYVFLGNTVDLQYGYDPDPTMAGFGSRIVMPNLGDVVPPDDMQGNCIYHTVRLTGSVARNNAPTLNGGTITITQGTQLITATYNTTMSAYSDDDSMGTMFMFGQPAMFHIAGGPDITAQSATVTFPPMVDNSTFTSPADLSLSMDNVITWTPPADTSGNLAAVTWVLDMNNANVIVCAVPACAGTMTIPAGLLSRHYTSGEAGLLQGLGFARTATVTSGTHSIDLRLESFAFASPGTIGGG